MCEGALIDVPGHLLLISTIDLMLPCLEDVINDLRWCVGLEQLWIVVCLGNEVPQTIESCNHLRFSRVSHL